MKRTKNNLLTTLTAIVLLITATIAQAQQAGKPSGHRPQGREQQMPPVPDSIQIAKMVTELSTELTLTEDQHTVIAKAFFNHFDEVKALTEKGKRPDRQIMDAVKKSFEAEVEAVLTKDQNKLFKDFMKKRHAKPEQPQR